MIPGVKIFLGGTEYIVPPLSLGSLEELQDRIASFREGTVDPASVKMVIDCSLRALKRNYPEMTREQLVEVLDVGNMGDVMGAVMDVSGVRRKQQEQDAGKAAAG